MLDGIDISNLQGPPSRYRNQTWYQNAAFVVVQALQPPYPYDGWDHIDAVTGLKGYTGEQLTAAREDGKYVSIYTFLYHAGRDVRRDTLSRLTCVPIGFALDFRSYVDEEDETPYDPNARFQEFLTALAAHDEWCQINQTHLPQSGGYSRDQYIRDFLDGQWPADRVYWQADYAAGPNPELLPMRPMVQYTSTPVDRDAMLESEIVTTTPPPSEPPADADPAWVAKKPTVVNAAGEINQLCDEIDVELKRAAPRKTIIRPKVQGIRDRANLILS